MSVDRAAPANPPPGPVVAAGALLGLQGVGVLVLASVVLISGFLHHAAVGQLLGQTAYFAVLAVLMVVIGISLIRGKRWARTPTIVLQLIAVAIGIWLVGDSAQRVAGSLVIGVSLITGGLLFTPAAVRWLNSFPSMFGPEPDR